MSISGRRTKVFGQHAPDRAARVAVLGVACALLLPVVAGAQVLPPDTMSDCDNHVPIVVASDKPAQSDLYSAFTLAAAIDTTCVVLAGARDEPIPDDQRARLDAARPGGWIVGGEAAVPSAKVAGHSLRRLAGADRWHTAQLVGQLVVTLAVTNRLPGSASDCPPLDGTAELKSQFSRAPRLCIDESQFYAVDFATTVGDFTVVLDPELDPVSVNNFVILAAHRAFDDTIFHRVISGFVVQGGDVQRLDGRGSPGYRFTGSFAEPGWYREGAVAMANSGSPSTNGSQFFIVTGPNGVGLPPIYSPLGYVTSGYDVVEAIEGTETGAGDKPTTDVTVTSAALRIATDTERESFEAAFTP